MFSKIRRRFSEITTFVKDVANDPRIPERDKKVLLGLLALILSPIDIIPDWIPVFGQIDDIVMLALILDYFFRVLDAEILLSHDPWDMKSFARLRRWSGVASALAPSFVKCRLWRYVGSPYQ